MQLKKFSGGGSTPARRRFWDDLRDAIQSASKLSGHNIAVSEQYGSGTVVEAQIRTGTTYGVTGACCIDGSCSLRTRTDCEGSGGNYLGDGTTCEDVDCTHGACCHPDGSCTIETSETCTDAYQGDGTTCEGVDCTHTGACCHPDGTCSIEISGRCDGDYQGDGTTCDPNPCPPPCDCGGFLNPDDGLYYNTRIHEYSIDNSNCPSDGSSCCESCGPGDPCCSDFFCGNDQYAFFAIKHVSKVHIETYNPLDDCNLEQTFETIDVGTVCCCFTTTHGDPPVCDDYANQCPPCDAHDPDGHPEFWTACSVVTETITYADPCIP